MYGPHYGHNIQPFWDFFQDHPEFELRFVSKESVESYESSKNIQFITLTSIFQWREILKESVDLIWFHGGYDIKSLMAVLFWKREIPLNLNIWGEQIPLMSLKLNIKGFLLRRLFKKCESIQCNWYGTQKILKPLKLSHVHVAPWGLEKGFFEKSLSLEPETQTAKEFISQVDKGKYHFFFPKSILNVSAHLEIVEATKILKEQNVSDFMIYFWAGNNCDPELLEKLKKKISTYKLEEYISFEQHPFLPFEDMRKIWSVMDCGLQLVHNDQMSTSFLEPQWLQKEILASEIAPYQEYVQRFDLDIPLVPNDPIYIAEKMKYLIQRGCLTSPESLKRRQQVIQEKFHFSKNLLTELKRY